MAPAAPSGMPPTPVGSQPPAAAPAPPAAAPSHASSSETAPNTGPCVTCGFQNPPGFKFCGRCGTTLTEVAAPDVGNANTIFVADASEVQAAAAAHEAELAQQALANPPQPGLGPEPGLPAAAEPQPVDDALSTAKQSPADLPSELGAAPVGPPAKLVMLGPDGQPVGERALTPGERLDVGRDSGPPWDDDAYLDPQHAYVTVTEEGLLIDDSDSLNGVFVKLSGRIEVQNGDLFRVGQELIQYEDLPEPTPTDDGTERMGSPNPGYWGRLSIMVDPGSASMAFPIEGEGIMIGREHGDITFPQDGYVSGKHCRVVGDDTGVYMEDLGSSNGTYMRVRSGATLPFGSLILIGQKLFQVERLDG